MGFVNEKRGTLEYLTSSAIHVPHCFSTRLGASALERWKA